MAPSDHGVSGNHPKSMKIPRSVQYPNKPTNVARRSPTGVKIKPKISLPTPNRWIGDKIEILQKPWVLLWFTHMQPLHYGIISIPCLPKRWTWKLPPTLTSQITENHPIVTKVGPRRLPKCILKSIKIDIWPSLCPLGAPLEPMITKKVPQVPKTKPEGLQYDSFKCKNTKFSSQPASSFLHPRGPAAGAKP